MVSPSKVNIFTSFVITVKLSISVSSNACYMYLIYLEGTVPPNMNYL